MSDLSPRQPKNRQLLWSDAVLDIQEKLLDLVIDAPLYLVGGAVRDAFLSRPVKDLDFATSGDSIKIARTIANALNGDVFVMDEERGVARVFVDTSEGRLTLDVAAFRGDDLRSDLLGRDFTINAMAVDFWGALGLLIDPLNGEADASIRLLRRCTENSIADDPIRALRAVRQSVQLKLHIEPDTQMDIRQHAQNLRETSPERIRDEFFKLLELEKPTGALKVADALGLLNPFLPQLDALKSKIVEISRYENAWKHSLECLDRLSGIFNTVTYRRNDNTAASFSFGMLAIQLDRFRPKLNEHLHVEHPNERKHYALLMLGGLLYQLEDAPNKAAKIADDLKLSNPEKKRLVGMIKHYQDARRLDFKSDLAQHRYWYPLREIGIDAMFLSLADYLASSSIDLDQDAWLIEVERALAAFYNFYEQESNIVNPMLYLNGNDLMEIFGLEGGKLIGDLLTLLREGQATGEITNREQAIQAAQNYLSKQ